MIAGVDLECQAFVAAIGREADFFAVDLDRSDFHRTIEFHHNGAIRGFEAEDENCQEEQRHKPGSDHKMAC